MEFEIKPTWRGLIIRRDSLEYTFTSRLFSHSSKLYDTHSNVIASLTRVISWRMDFELVANDNIYQLRQRLSGNKLILKESKNLSDLGGYDVSNKPISLPLTSHRRISRFWNRGWEISFNSHETEHLLAFLIVACLECYWMDR